MKYFFRQILDFIISLAPKHEIRLNNMKHSIFTWAISIWESHGIHKSSSFYICKLTNKGLWFVSIQNELILNFDPLNGWSARRKAITYTIQEEYRVIFTPRVGLEPAIPMLERAMAFLALDRAATVLGYP
jgi:hypothetical protein